MSRNINLGILTKISSVFSSLTSLAIAIRELFLIKLPCQRGLDFCRVSRRLSTTYKGPGNYFWVWRAGETHQNVTPLGRRLGKVPTLQLHLSRHSVLYGRLLRDLHWDYAQSSVEALSCFGGKCSAAVLPTLVLPVSPCAGGIIPWLPCAFVDVHTPSGTWKEDWCRRGNFHVKQYADIAKWLFRKQGCGGARKKWGSGTGLFSRS